MFFKTNKKIIITIIIILCVISVIVSIYATVRPKFMEKPVSFVVTPVQKAFTSVGNWFSEQIDFFVNMSELKTENERLKQELAILKMENSRMNIMNNENHKMTEMLKLKRTYEEFSYVGGNISARDPRSWYGTFIIDVGSSSGVEENMIAVYGDGLVGKITKVNINNSTVTPIIDELSAVSAKCTRTGDIGYVKGDIKLKNDGKCRMELISADAQIIVGDEIVTSGLSDYYPEDIVIGYVEEISMDAIGTKRAIISLSVDFKSIEAVIVIMDKYKNVTYEDFE